MVKLIIAGCLGIAVGWASNSLYDESRCRVQNVKLDRGIWLASGNVGCVIRNNTFSETATF